MSREPLDNQQLPPWLRGVPLPPRPPQLERPAADAPLTNQAGGAGAPTPAEPADMPDWLRDLSVAPAPPAASPPDFPAWLRDEPAAPAADQPEAAPQPPGAEALPHWLGSETQSPAADAEMIPDWLRGEPQAPTPPEQRAPQGPARPADTEPRLDWLQGEPQAPPRQADESALPDWLRGQAQPAPDQAADWLPDARPSAGEPARPEADTLPAWLGGMAQPESAPGNADEPPDWLRDLPAQAPAGVQPALPDWLRGEAEEPPASVDQRPPAYPAPETSSGGAGAAEARSQALPATPQADDAGIPDWLRDIPTDEIQRVMAEDDEPDITIEPFTFEGAPTAPGAEPAPGVPAWLSGISNEPSAGAEELPSWFKEPTDTSPEPASLTPGSADMPLWLQDLEQAPASEAAPAWLSEASPPAPGPQARDSLPTESGPAVPEQQDSVPAWLRDAQPGQEPPADDVPAWLQDAESREPPPTGAVPAWLQDIEQTPPPPAAGMPAWHAEPPAPAPPTGPPPAPTGDLPEWLRPEVPHRTPASPGPGPAAGDDLPEWLRTSEPAAPAAAAPAWPQPSAPPTSPAAPAGGADLPPWLRDEAGKPLPSAGAPGETSLPEWLRGAPIEPTAAPAQAHAAPPAEPPRDQARAAPVTTRLDWFGDDTPSRTQGPAPAGGEGGFFGGAELPAWLRPPEPEPSVVSPSDARSLDWLKKLGTLDEDGDAAVAMPMPLLPLPTAPIRTQAQVAALALLERLAADPFPDTVPAPEPAVKSTWQRIGLERLISVALLIALLIALTVPALGSALQTPPVAPGAEELLAQIGALTENDVVLVGYEWDARRIGEMRPLEQAVIEHLIEKKVKLVLVSTDPQGTLLSFDLRDKLTEAKYRPGGNDYILLGYKPGGELALRSFAQDFYTTLQSDFLGSDATIGVLATGFETDRPLRTLNDLSMMLVLADDVNDVQAWMEQIHRSAPQVPMAFLLPQEAAPIVQPYLRQAGIYHLAGKQGALAYQMLRGGGTAPEQTLREASQQRLAILVFAGLLVVGAIAVAVSEALMRRRRPS